MENDMVDDSTKGPAGRVVLIAGATSASGRAVARALLDAGAVVVAVGSDRGRLEAMAAEFPGLVTELADLTDQQQVWPLAMRVHGRVGDVDGVVHLVGGWRGGGGLPGQTEEDYRVLERSFSALRHLSRALWDDLVGSSAGRITIISSTTVEHPTAGGANYTAVKAASESWMQSVAQGLGKAGDRGAAVTFRVKALEGLEERFAERVVALWREDASALNGRVETLTAE